MYDQNMYSRCKGVPGLCFVAIALLALVTAQPARANFVNGGFETGDFTGWTTIGIAQIKDAAYGSGPTEGTFQALLATQLDPNLSGVLTGDLETFLGLAAGSLNGVGNGTVRGGSAILQTFTATAGQILSFDWNFLTSELNGSPPDPNRNDFAFVSINGAITKLADTTNIVTNFSAPTTNAPDFVDETGFQNFSFLVPANGTYTLAVGVVDVNTVAALNINSGVLVDNFLPPAVAAPIIPEPSSLLLVGVGAIATAVYARRRRRPAAKAVCRTTL